MKAIQVQKTGGPEALTLVDLPVAQPNTNWTRQQLGSRTIAGLMNCSTRLLQTPADVFASVRGVTSRLINMCKTVGAYVRDRIIRRNVRLLPGLSVIATLVMLGSIAYSHRLYIAATLWHWNHGDVVRVGNYEVPVPRDWLVQVGPADLTSLIDARSDGGRNVIMLVASQPNENIEIWRSYRERQLKDDGLRNLEERSLSFDNETVTCLGGHELSEAKWSRGSVNLSNVISLECLSSGSLRLIFTGQQQNLQMFYSMVPKIRRVS